MAVSSRARQVRPKSTPAEKENIRVEFVLLECFAGKKAWVEHKNRDLHCKEWISNVSVIFKRGCLSGFSEILPAKAALHGSAFPEASLPGE